MKRFLLPLMLCALTFTSSYAQEADSFFLSNAPGKVLADLGEIPGWVRESVSSKEYRVLEDASQYFKIDYTFLYRHNEAGLRDKAFSSLKKAVSDIKSGRYEEASALGPLYGYVGFIHIDQNIDRSRDWLLKSYTRISETMSLSCEYTRIYTDNTRNAGVEVCAWFLYDSVSGKADVVYTSVTEVGQNVVPGRPGQERCLSTGSYDENSGEVVVSTAGTLDYYAGDGTIHSIGYNGSIAFCPSVPESNRHL